MLQRHPCERDDASWRANHTLEMPADVCHGVIDAYAVPTEEHPFTEKCERAHAGSEVDPYPSCGPENHGDGDGVEGDFTFVAPDEIF